MGEPVNKTNSGRRAVRWVEPGIFCGIFYPLGCGYRAARLDAGLFLGIFSWLGVDIGLVARRGLNMARVCLSRRLPLGAWDNSAESSGGACRLPPSPIKLIFAPVSSYG